MVIKLYENVLVVTMILMRLSCDEFGIIMDCSNVGQRVLYLLFKIMKFGESLAKRREE